MLKFILGIILYLFTFFDYAIAKNNTKDNSCKWENELQTPCVEINSYISNTSKFTKSSINRKIITKKQINEIGATDLIDVLRIIPEINLTQSGPKGQQASMFMRGTNSNHTLVMINGIPINDQSTTQGLHDFGVDFIQTIQQIEIYPGSSATNFGTNSIGGAVNIVLTGDYKDSISLINDNENNYEISANKNYIFDNSSLNIKIASVKNDTISAKGNLDDEKDGVKNYTTNLNFEKYLKPDLRFFNTVYLRQTKAKYDNSATNQTGYEGNNRMGALQIGVDNSTDSREDKYILYYNIYDREYDERGTIDTYESEVIGLKYELSKSFINLFSIGLGTEYKYDWGYFDNKGSYEASTKGNSDNLSAYGNIGWNFMEAYNLSFFTRIDRHKYTGSNQTYKINLEQDLSGFSKLGVAFMNGLRNPTLYELFGTDNYGYSGNRDLKSEKSNTYEIYSNFTLNRNTKLNLRGFRSNIKNNIEYINNQYKNDNDGVNLTQSGIGTDISYDNSNLNLKFFTSFTSSKKENRNDQLRRPNKNYGLFFNKKVKNKYFGKINIGGTYNHYGQHFDTHSSNFSTIKMDSTDLIDLNITKKLNNKTFFIKFSNLLDEGYQRPHGYNQEGRNIKIGLKY